MKILCLFVCVALAAPLAAQSEAPTPSTKFEWKLRLKKGQTWTQTTKHHTEWVQPQASNDGQGPDIITQKLIFDSSETFKTEVLNTTPTFYSLRVTLLDSQRNSVETLDGKVQPLSSIDLETALIGASFLMRQTPDGEVVEVSGLDDWIARERAALAPLAKKYGMSPEEAAKFISPERIRLGLINSNTLDLPEAPLVVGEETSRDLEISGDGKFVVLKRNLRFLDSQSAKIDEVGNFTIPWTQLTGRKAGSKPEPNAPIEAHPLLKTFNGDQTGSVSIATEVLVGSGLISSRTIRSETSGLFSLVLPDGQKKSAPTRDFNETTIVTFFKATR